MEQTDKDGDSNKALAWANVEGCREKARGHDPARSGPGGCQHNLQKQ